MSARPAYAIRSVVVPIALDPRLRDALLDVRSAVNSLIPDWRSHPEDSRFDAIKRTYSWTRAHYPHLASPWAVSIANETSATLNSWDRQLRRAKRFDARKWERLRLQVPRRSRLKVSLQRELYRMKGRILDITLHKNRHLLVDLSGARNPLFEKYGMLSGWEFGLAITDRALVFQFRVPRTVHLAPESVGVDVNMPSADFVTSDGHMGAIDLRPITAIQGAMAR
ncbi:MAG: hypothetical protein L3K19_08640 [Thermoplasmata archaeon]|nr:hypothetical protein [Thermoplasmata archaeon]